MFDKFTLIYVVLCIKSWYRLKITLGTFYLRKIIILINLYFIRSEVGQGEKNCSVDSFKFNGKTGASKTAMKLNTFHSR